MLNRAGIGQTGGRNNSGDRMRMPYELYVMLCLLTGLTCNVERVMSLCTPTYGNEIMHDTVVQKCEFCIIKIRILIRFRIPYDYQETRGIRKLR